MKILILDTVDNKLISSLEQNNMSYDVDYTSPKQEVEKKIHNYHGIIIRSRFKIDRDFILNGHKLKFIARFGAGLENIDTEFAEQNNIKIINSAQGNSQAVAEHALGMLLSLTKNIIKSNDEIKLGIWKREENRGHEISGKTIGIIGYGNIGKLFARCVSGFGANVISYDIKNNYQDAFTKESKLEDIFNKSDIVSIHTDLTNVTEGMCNDDFFKKFKKNIWFINTARGKIVNTKDLVNNIKSGKILGACLDVLEHEKTSFEDIDNNKDLEFLKKDDRVVLTSHIAGWSFESNSKMSDIIFQKIYELCKA